MQLVLSYTLASALFLSGIIFSYQQLEQLDKEAAAHPAFTSNEVLLFPDGHALQGIAFGYRNFLSNILWFNTINYFGKQYKGTRNYDWLAHMCSLSYKLDPKARHIPEFCALMLAWEANDPPGAIRFLDTAVAADPDYWRYYYLRGVTNILFLQDAETARDDFHRGAVTPDAPVFMARLATKTLANLDSPQTAISFLKGMVNRAKDPNERAALERHLKQTIHNARIVELEELVAQRGQGSEALSLADLGLSAQQLADPYGGTYYWDAESKSVMSTSGVSRGKVISKRFKHGK